MPHRGADISTLAIGSWTCSSSSLSVFIGFLAPWPLGHWPAGSKGSWHCAAQRNGTTRQKWWSHRKSSKRPWKNILSEYNVRTSDKSWEPGMLFKTWKTFSLSTCWTTFVLMSIKSHWLYVKMSMFFFWHPLASGLWAGGPIKRH